MTQFQTVPPPALDAKLQLPKQPAPKPLTRISLHLGAEITLELAGRDVGSLILAFVDSGAGSTLSQKLVSVTPTKQTITIKALRPGKVAIHAQDDAGKRVASLVVVAGKVEKHKLNGVELDVDLLAEAARGNDGHINNEIRKLLHNDPHNLFDQRAPHNHHPKYGDLTCGMVCRERSQQIFGKINVLNYDEPYHEPLNKVTKRSDVKYKPETIEVVKHRIIGLLKTGSPVRVGVLDAPIGMFVAPGKKGGKLIAWYGGGHTVVIVGWSAATDSFMYIDTWPGGSRMVYNGGITGEQNSAPCEYLGLLTRQHDPQRVLAAADKRFNIIRSVVDTEGTFDTANDRYLEIVSGP